MNEAIRRALKTDKLIDIITIGVKSGQPRTTEIWFMNVNGRIIICGTPNTDGKSGTYTPRDWMANLLATPDFTFCFKESIHAQLAATAKPITDLADRRYLMSAPATQWYRDQVESIDDLVTGSPIVEIFFKGV
ncbi:MAG: DUF385 domain-containing protein [Chloroflexi bacterium]|nr:MAG: DUF385 domain-containing protein [Chloroflexota bacterium]